MMTNIKTVWNFTEVKCMADSMRKRVVPIQVHLTIPFSINPPQPRPTLVVQGHIHYPGRQTSSPGLIHMYRH